MACQKTPAAVAKSHRDISHMIVRVFNAQVATLAFHVFRHRTTILPISFRISHLVFFCVSTIFPILFQAPTIIRDPVL